MSDGYDRGEGGGGGDVSFTHCLLYFSCLFDVSKFRTFQVLLHLLDTLLHYGNIKFNSVYIKVI